MKPMTFNEIMLSKMGAQLARLRRRAYIMYKRGDIYGHLPSFNFTIHHLDGHYKKVKRIVEFQMARARRKRFLTSRRETRIGREGHAQPMIISQFSSHDLQHDPVAQHADSQSRRTERVRRERPVNAQSVINSDLEHQAIREHAHYQRTRPIRRESNISRLGINSGAIINEPWNFGRPTNICKHCRASVWYEERSDKNRNPLDPTFSICCMDGRVKLPFLREPSMVLKKLLDYRGDRKSKDFRKRSRVYNAVFQFTSMGGDIDKNINRRGGPYTFRLSGQNFHLLGSLLPPDGQKPSFAQLYVHDTENEVQNRLGALNGKSLDEEIVKDLMKMLDDHNVLVQSFRMARDMFIHNEVSEFKLRLIANRNTDARQYNLPSCSEVAALVIGSDGSGGSQRDIIIQHKTRGLQRITELHPSYMALQYPLLFPYGEDGFRVGIEYENTNARKKYVLKSLSLRQYYAFRLQQRPEGETLLRGGRLLQQYMVDAYACIEENKLNWARNNQQQLRAELYSGLQDAIQRSDLLTDNIGRITVLPSTHTGGPRYRVQNYQDAMAICRSIGYPDLFITFTCNAKWPEIGYFIENIDGQKNMDRIDVVSRVFSIKLRELLHDIKKRQFFGKTIGVVYTIEFQKRGLPHAHILVFLHPDHKFNTAFKIDEIISAKIPNKDLDPSAFRAVENFMVHGPCGIFNHNSPCMVKESCSKHFPKKFNEKTYTEEDGFPVYMRRNDGKHILKNGVKLDNRYVVPYNRNLVVKYDAHINVEVCNRSRSVKYLFKYVNKGPDRVTAVVTNESSANTTSHQHRNTDEIKTYLQCRYISAAEASWRIFKFHMFHREPSVERLSFHLPDQQTVYFQAGTRIHNVLRRSGIERTMFTEWMATNMKYEDARELTYADFPTKWVWNSSERVWTRRKKGYSIGRIYFAPPTSGPRYYLRMLLNIVKGCRSFEEIKTVNGVLYDTFKQACYALGLLQDDKEYNDCIKEASLWGTGHQLRELFCTILLHGEVIDPNALWNANWIILSEDLLYRQRRLMNFPDLKLSDQQIQNYGLLEIEKSLQRIGKSLADYHGMQMPDANLVSQIDNRLISQELNYNRQKLHDEYSCLFVGLNLEQKNIHDKVIHSVEEGEGRLFFVYGHGGTGKTYLWRTIISKLRAEGKIVLAVASSGIAALLLPGGRTAHSRFHIPLNPTEDSTCAIKKGTQLSQLIIQTSLIIWDEAPMANKRCFEAVDKTLRDILAGCKPNAKHLPFGGITTALGGDFRQILPVVPNGGREETVTACIKTSYLWQHCELYKLQENMRLKSNTFDLPTNQNLQTFANWILDIGDGCQCSENGEAWIKIPPDLMLQQNNDAITSITDNTYPNLNHHYSDSEYLVNRAILTPKNDAVVRINDHIIRNLPGDERLYLSSDSICKGDYNLEDQSLSYPIEFLNTLIFPGFPNHVLKLKIGVPVMLLRNLNQAAGLYNGTRLKITQLGKWFIEGDIMTGSNIGEKILIPRISLSPSESKWPFVLSRRQYPLSLCFAMTINKSQGQSLQHVGLYLPKQIFTHGQLYVAFSRVTSRQGLHVLTVDKEQPSPGMIKNIVFKEVL